MGLSKTQKRHAEQMRKDAEAILGTPAAMRFLCTILDECGYFTDTHRDDGTTEYQTGKRATGLAIVRSLENANPDALLKLLDEASKARDRLAQTRQEDDTNAD